MENEGFPSSTCAFVFPGAAVGDGEWLSGVSWTRAADCARSGSGRWWLAGRVQTTALGSRGQWSAPEHLPPQGRKDLKEVGWMNGRGLAKFARQNAARSVARRGSCQTLRGARACTGAAVHPTASCSGPAPDVLHRPILSGGNCLDRPRPCLPPRIPLGSS